MKVLALLGMFGIALLPAQNTITVEGLVVDAATGAGIDGAAILGYGPGLVFTDQQGNFRISGPAPGDFRVFAQKQGYFNRAPVQFHVNANGNPVQLRLELIPPAILRGRVFGTDGKPARATVDLGPDSRNTVSTNDDGYFTFDQVPPGSFILLSRPKDAEPVSTPEGLRTGVVATYYPSTLERSQAESITVRAGAELSGYEIRLQSAPVYRVSGVVLDLNGDPAPDAVVQLLDKVPDGFTGYSGGRQVFSIRRSLLAGTPNATQSTSTGDDGTFEFPSVRPGDWTVRVESDPVRDEVLQRDVILFGSATISLGDRDLDDLKLQLRMPFDFSGTVDEGDASPSIAHSVAVTLTGETGYFGGSVRADVDGRLHFEGVIPGRYLITTDVDGNYYASAQLGSSDVTGQTMELTASSPPMRVVLQHGGTIRWTLDPSSSWTVVLFPRTLTGFGYSNSNLYTNSQLTGIPPGEYYAIALDRFDPRAMADAPHLRALVPSATSVRVEEGSDASLQLKIIHAPD